MSVAMYVAGEHTGTRKRAGVLAAIRWAARTDAKAFADDLRRAGFEHFAPEPPTQHAALGAACRAVAGRAQLAAFATAKRGRTSPWGLYRLDEHTKERIEHTARLVVSVAGERLTFIGPADHDRDLVDAISEAYRDELTGIGPEALRAWFSGRIAKQFRATSATMGYFLPAPQVPRWDAFSNVLTAHAHNVIAFDVYSDHRAMLEDVHDAFTAEVTDTAKRVESSIFEAKSHVGLDSAERQAADLDAKIGTFEELLGSRFDRSQLARLRVAIGAARLALGPAL